MSTKNYPQELDELLEAIELFGIKKQKVASFLGLTKGNLSHVIAGKRGFTSSQLASLKILTKKLRKLPADLWTKGACHGKES